MKLEKRYIWLPIFIWSLLFSACQQNQTFWQVSSPNGNIMVAVKLDPVTGTVTYDALLHTESNTITALERSTLGLVREDMDFSENLRFHAFREQSINEPYSVISGKRINDVNHCNEITLAFKNQEDEIIEMSFRAYDEAIAFRYHFPAKDSGKFTVIDELSSFNLNATDGKAWMQTYDTIRHWSLGYEIPYHREIPIGTSAPVSYGWALPLLFEKEDGTWVFISEADLDEHFAGMHVRQHASGGNYMLEFPEEEYYEVVHSHLGDDDFDRWGEQIILAARNRKASWYLDGEEFQTFRFDTTSIKHNEEITIEMIPLGGFVVVLAPA